MTTTDTTTIIVTYSLVVGALHTTAVSCPGCGQVTKSVVFQALRPSHPDDNLPSLHVGEGNDHFWTAPVSDGPWSPEYQGRRQMALVPPGTKARWLFAHGQWDAFPNYNGEVGAVLTSTHDVLWVEGPLAPLPEPRITRSRLCPSCEGHAGPIMGDDHGYLVATDYGPVYVTPGHPRYTAAGNRWMASDTLPDHYQVWEGNLPWRAYAASDLMMAPVTIISRLDRDGASLGIVVLIQGDYGLKIFEAVPTQEAGWLLHLGRHRDKSALDAWTDALSQVGMGLVHACPDGCSCPQPYDSPAHGEFDLPCWGCQNHPRCPHAMDALEVI